MKSCLRPARARSGFTVLEMVIGLAILSMVAANVMMVTGSSKKAYEAGSSMSALDLQLDRTINRIALAVMAARKDSLSPANPFPLFTPSLRFDQSKGFENGVEVIGDLEQIEFVSGPEQVVWKENPDTADERRVVWTNWVREYFKDELHNGVDDDANGLSDEDGLCFTIDGNRVTIRLTLEREGPDHKLITRTQETTVTCRN